MTPEEINRTLAEKVMGYELTRWGNNKSPVWKVGDSEYQPYEWWHPTNPDSPTQAVICAEKWCADNDATMELTFYTDWVCLLERETKVYGGAHCMQYKGHNNKLSTAICNALIEAIGGEG